MHNLQDDDSILLDDEYATFDSLVEINNVLRETSAIAAPILEALKVRLAEDGDLPKGILDHWRSLAPSVSLLEEMGEINKGKLAYAIGEVVLTPYQGTDDTWFVDAIFDNKGTAVLDQWTGSSDEPYQLRIYSTPSTEITDTYAAPALCGETVSEPTQMTIVADTGDLELRMVTFSETPTVQLPCQMRSPTVTHTTAVTMISPIGEYRPAGWRWQLL